MTVYVLFVDGFEETEAIVPIDIMRRAGIDVKTVGVNSTTVTGAHSITMKTDISMADVDKSKMSALMLPGGPGHTALKTESVYELINYAVDNSLIIASICAAPSVIGEMGLLKDKYATVFPGFEDALVGAKLTDEKCVCDGLFITAKGAGAASEFGFAITSALLGENKANEIKTAMQY